MPFEDLYAVLGVNSEVTLKEIERAFRKLTRKYHPEVNPGDEASTVRYQVICQAYEILGDKGQREEYDRLGCQEFFQRHRLPGEKSDDRPESDFWSDIFREGFIGEIFGLKEALLVGDQPLNGEDIQHFIVLDFLDAVKGKEAIIQISPRTVCTRCRGTGAAPGSRMERCSDCGGAGQNLHVRGPFNIREACKPCGGRGYILRHPCPACSGSGMIVRQKTVRVQIPAGVSTGTEIKIKGGGHEGLRGGKPGDLVLITRVEDHSSFTRKGDNIYSVVPVMVWEAALGANVLIPTVDGKVALSLPPGTQTGQTFRLPHKGAPNRKTGRKGDHFVAIKVVIPAPKDKRSLSAYKELAKIFPDNPRVK